jgi:hypothetical protein
MPTEIAQIPRAPLVLNPKTDTLDNSDGYTRSLMQWREAAREEAIALRRMNPEWDRVRTYIDMIEGKQWSRPLPRYRSRWNDNRMAETRIDRLSLLTDIRPAVEIRCNVPDYQQQADIAQKIIFHEWARQDLDLALVAAVDHALLSVGYWKIGAAMPGEMFVIPCGMDTVLPIQPGRDIQQSSAVLYRTYKPVWYFKEAYGKAAEGIEREAAAPIWTNINNQNARPGFLEEYTFSSMSPAMRYMNSQRALNRSFNSTTGPGSFPVAEVEEYWVDDHSVNESNSVVVVKDPRYSTEQHNYHYKVRPGERLFPRKRLIVFVGSRVLYDGPSPYWHGLFPFAELALNPVVWAPGGLSAYRNLVPVQRAINELGAGILDLCRRAVEPQLVTREGAVADAAWNQFYGDMPGGKLKLTGMGNPSSDVQYMQPPPLPAYAQGFMQYLGQAFDRMSGNIDATQLMNKKQISGGDTIEQLKDSQNSGFRLESRYIEPFLRSAGLIAVANIFQYWVREKRMWMFGADGVTLEDFDYDPTTMAPWTMPREDHWKLFSVVISQGSLHGAASDRLKQVAISLFRLGAVSRNELLRKMEWGGPDKLEIINQELAEQNATGMAPDATGKGQVPRLTRGARTGNPY